LPLNSAARWHSLVASPCRRIGDRDATCLVPKRRPVDSRERTGLSKTPGQALDRPVSLRLSSLPLGSKTSGNSPFTASLIGVVRYQVQASTQTRCDYKKRQLGCIEKTHATRGLARQRVAACRVLRKRAGESVRAGPGSRKKRTRHTLRSGGSGEEP